MAPIWHVVQQAGWAGYVLIPVAMLACVLAALGLLGGLIANNSRPFTFAASEAVATSALGSLLGGFGTWYGRSRVDRLLGAGAAAIDDFSRLQKIWTVGYDEARAAPMVTRVLLALPWHIGLLAEATAWLRSRNAAGSRPVADVAIAGLMALVSIFGLAFSSYGVRDGREEAKTRALAMLNETTAGVLAKTTCDPCPLLADACGQGPTCPQSRTDSTMPHAPTLRRVPDAPDAHPWVWYPPSVSSRQERSDRRRAEWVGEIVEPGQPKGNLYAHLTLEQRFAAFILLNERA